MTELSKYFNSETREINRSEITLAEYNPRTISKEGRQALKKSIKSFGVVGGIIWNEKTGTLVGGHQKINILDELNKYNSETQENDYKLKVEVINVDEKTEKELNITLNNPNVGGEWDYDLLREILPDVDYRKAGLTEEDLSLIGIDFTLQTDNEIDLADELNALSAPIYENREAEKEMRKEAVREMKKQIQDNAEDKVKDMESYVMVNFQTYAEKAKFMLRFGFNAPDKFIQGEYLVKLIDEMS